MATFDDLSFLLRTTLKLYPWRTIDPVPAATLRKPLREARVALVTTGGIVPPGRPPFDEGMRGGDWTLRMIPGDVDVSALTESHRSESFDHTGVEQDRNMAFPLDRLRELAAEGLIGEVAPRHFSFMGSLTAPGRLIKTTAPEAALALVEDRVDVALLVPV
jgi:D-proline reductase (dithiol) PrdB